ncbi:hypothetical protein CGMCC3_g10105 [Colletotrichum fructicola]|nr:uncharacterized protein CGMCC3_g10105 [Colletotrichum fructicola]KAE9573803.1 hypothetical protein CGMCC3_g10105 [Colletotrichum fructicola]
MGRDGMGGGGLKGVVNVIDEQAFGIGQSP